MLLKVSAKSLKFSVTESFFYKVTASKPANNNKLTSEEFFRDKTQSNLLDVMREFLFFGIPSNGCV